MDRIQELILAAQQQAAKETIANSFAYENLVYTKFAELIVKECAQVCGPEDSYTDEWFKAKADSVQKIKQHFGVES
jgi:hypothetical protein